MKRSDQHDPKPSPKPSPKHDPRTCPLCALLRHPGQAAQGRALTRHLAAHPLPRQAVNA